MSVIDDLGKDNEHLVDILFKYEDYLDNVPSILTMEGKTLEFCNIEQPRQQAFYDEKRIELSTLTKHFETEVARVRGKLWIQFTETHSVALSTRDKDQYINREPAFLKKNKLLLEVQEIYKKYEAVTEAFKARGFALRNITNLRVASLESIVL